MYDAKQQLMRVRPVFNPYSAPDHDQAEDFSLSVQLRTNTQHRVSWAYFILLGSVSTFWLKVMLLVETCFAETTLLLSLSCETTLLLSLLPASEGQDGKHL